MGQGRGGGEGGRGRYERRMRREMVELELELEERGGTAGRGTRGQLRVVSGEGRRGFTHGREGAGAGRVWSLVLGERKGGREVRADELNGGRGTVRERM